MKITFFMWRAKALILFIAIVFISCRKKGDASGQIINIMNGNPIEGLTVHLDEYKLGLISAKTIKKHIETTVTNSNGEFSMNYGSKLEARYKNRLVYIDDAHFAEMDTNALFDVKYDYGNYPGCEKMKWDYSENSKKNIIFYLAPLSRIKVIPHNITSTYTGLSISVYLFDDKFSALAAYYNNGNTSTSSSYYTQFPSNGTIYIRWEIQGSIFTNFYDTIHVAPFAKTIYHLNY
jgi:hypothetical protein